MAARVELDLPVEALEALDRAVASGHFPSRAAALEEGLRRLLHVLDASDSYSRAYAECPEEEKYGQVGLDLIRERVSDERSR